MCWVSLSPYSFIIHFQPEIKAVVLAVVYFLGPAKTLMSSLSVATPAPPVKSFAAELESSMEKKDSSSSDEKPVLPLLSDIDEEILKDLPISFQVPNPGFIFHNKLPKSGSTTMHNILTVLSQWNNFEHIKIDSAMMQFEDEVNLIG